MKQERMYTIAQQRLPANTEHARTRRVYIYNRGAAASC